MQENQPQENAQGAELDGAAAYIMANRLILVPRFPRDPVAVEQVADWLLDLCRGGKVDDEPWTPHDQAGWLIETTIKEFSNWDQSQGLPAMRSIFNRKFNPPPAQVEFPGLGEKPVIHCTLCSDNGTIERDGIVHWCICPQANKLLKEAPQLVEILNRPGALKRAAELRQAAKATVQQVPAHVETPEEERERMAAIRVEIARIKREREHDARTAKLRTGRLFSLQWPRLSRMLRHWTSRIRRMRVS